MSLSGSTRSHLTPRPSSASGLWGHLMRSTVSQAPSSTTTTSSTTLGRHAAPVAPLDKAGASTRILLHDTQAHLEKFTERVGVLATGFENAKQELSTVQKLYHDEHEQLVDRMIGLGKCSVACTSLVYSDSLCLANRCQTELQKTIGNPAQTADVREVSKDLSTFATRLETLDKKIDTLNVVRVVHPNTRRDCMHSCSLHSSTRRNFKLYKPSKTSKVKSWPLSCRSYPCSKRSLCT